MSSLSVKLSLPTRVQPEVMPKPGMAGVYTNQMHYFKKHVLDELSKKKFASDFMNPVDTEELMIPQYYSVIHRPMDVGTITKRVENNYYRDVEEAIADFRLLIRNCYMFNLPETQVYRKGIQLEKFFLRAINNIPKGPPVPCNKDPMSTCKIRANPMPGALEQECRNQLRKLQTVTNQADATARNFFGPKWNSFSAKLDKHFFKSLEEFRSHVDGMFNKYHDQAKAIYEQVYGQPSGYQGNNSTSTAASTSERAPNSASHINLSMSEANDLLLAYQLTQNSLNQCLKQPQKLKSLAETFCATMAQFQASLQVIMSAVAGQESPNNGQTPTPIVVEEKQIPAGLYLPTEGLEFLVDTPDAGLSEDDPKLEPIDHEERRSIQTLFCTLPARAMREICGIVHSNETLGRDKNGGFTFDLNTFELANVQIMKAAVARAVKLNSKIKLRGMQQVEKEDLCYSLESQLTDITRRLGQSGRRNSASLAKKRGRKRASSPSTQLEAGTAATGPTKRKALSKPYMPSTPVKLAPKASRSSGKSKKNREQLKCKFSCSPGGRITRITSRTPGRRAPVCRKNSNPANVFKDGQHAEDSTVQPQTEPKKPKKVKQFKTLADSSTDEDEDEVEENNNVCEAPSSSYKKSLLFAKDKNRAKQGQKVSNQKSRLFLAPGNVLNEDLSLSSSSSEENN